MNRSEDDKVSANVRRVRFDTAAAMVVLLMVAVGIASVLAWALFWPVADCDQPSCASHRFTVGVELDALGQVTPIALELSHESGPVSLISILRDGGIELVPVIDELGLPFDPSSGPLDPADLFQFVGAWRNRGSLPGTDATLYALFVNALIADNGEELFGIMFDTAGREGFAVAPRTTERFFQAREPEFIATLKLRTFAHELLHSLNRHHHDATQFGDGRLTLEAPTRCIAEATAREWRLIEPPLMALSPQTIRFFQTASARDVLPGPDNSPFTNRRASPTECDDARARLSERGDTTRWAQGMRRLRNLFGITTASAAESEPEMIEEGFATITLQAQDAAYPLGYPVAIRVLVHNVSDEELPIVDRLDPRYGMLQIEYRALGESQWRSLEPMAWLEPAENEHAMLAPRAHTEQTVPIYFGEDGWTFAEAGQYEVRARLQTGAAHSAAVSEPIAISIEAPRTEDDRQVLQPLLDGDGKLDRKIGRLLYFGGRIGDQDDIEPLEDATERFGHTAVGAALKLTLLSHRLRRPIDPTTGLRPPPDFDEARELLEDTCTDSGVAAMTSDLLRQRPGTLPSNIRNRSEEDAAVWDGVSSEGRVIGTYANAELERWGPSLHFCFNEAELRKPVNAEVMKLARELRRTAPERIVLVGHSDAVGSCRFNDALGLRRARAVQRALIGAGIRRKSIEVVSIGERRPKDFAWTPDAQFQNRRVDVLVQGGRSHSLAGEVRPICPESTQP